MDRQSDAAYMQRQRDALYGWSNGTAGLGLKPGTGEGLYFGGVRVTGYDRNDDFAAGAPRPGMVYTDGGWQNLDSSNVGLDGSPTADASTAIKNQAAALRKGWDREYWSVLQGERPAVYDLAHGTRTLLGSMTGYDATNAARASFAQGNYGTSAVQLLQGFVEAGICSTLCGITQGRSRMR